MVGVSQYLLIKLLVIICVPWNLGSLPLDFAVKCSIQKGVGEEVEEEEKEGQPIGAAEAPEFHHARQHYPVGSHQRNCS